MALSVRLLAIGYRLLAKLVLPSAAGRTRQPTGPWVRAQLLVFCRLLAKLRCTAAAGMTR